MKNTKQIILVGLVSIFLGAVLFFGYLTAQEESPLSMFNLRASNSQDEVDTFLTENVVRPTVSEDDPVSLAYNSTSPTVTPIAGSAGNVIPSVSVSPISSSTGAFGNITSTPTPMEYNQEVISLVPTAVSELPVAGIADNLNAVLIGGGVLILLAFLL